MEKIRAVRGRRYVVNIEYDNYEEVCLEFQAEAPAEEAVENAKKMNVKNVTLYHVDYAVTWMNETPEEEDEPE